MDSVRIVRNGSCRDGINCPKIERSEGGGFHVTGTDVPDDSLPPHERKVWVPDELLPELVTMDGPTFRTYLDGHRDTPGNLFRMQTLDRYNVASDGGDYERYIGGTEELNRDRAPWLEQMRAHAAAGLVWRNLHVVRTPLMPYLSYQFEWGYVDNVQAGQVIRVLDVNDHPAAEGLFATADFWVIKDREVVRQPYDDEGRILDRLGVSSSAAPAYIVLAEMAWAMATPFEDWWAAHPEYYRVNRTDLAHSGTDAQSASRT